MQIACKEYYQGEVKGLALSYQHGTFKNPTENSINMPTDGKILTMKSDLKATITKVFDDLHAKNSMMTISEMRALLFRCAAVLVHTPKVSIISMRIRIDLERLFQFDRDLLHSVVALPFEVFGPPAISTGIEVWTWIIGERPETEIPLIMEISIAWTATMKRRAGLFSGSMK